MMDSADAHAARREMAARQLAGRGIRDPRVLEAMGKVPRERFAPHLSIEEAYDDRAWGIGCDQTISQPYIVALMSEAARIEPEHRVLEVGTGSGYQAAILAELAREVVSIERHAKLSAQAGETLAELGYANVELVVGDGTKGWPAGAPYDRILVPAAAERCPPALLEQLAEGGILVIPIGAVNEQILRAYRREGDRFLASDLSPCRFVPLVAES